MNRLIHLVVALFTLLMLAAPALAGTVNLSIAASLKDVITELSDSFTRHHPGVTFLKNFGGSGALAKQIENGAPADIFISANLQWLEYLQTKKLIDTPSVGTFAFNTLVFAGTPGAASSLQDMQRLQKIAIGSPKSVPAGEYAVTAFKNAGIDRVLEKKLILARDVRDCLMYAERGEVDGAFVYRTDALLAKRAKILFEVPQNLYPRVTYPMALTVSGKQNKDADAFFNYLHGDEAKAVLARYGFATR